MKPRPHNPAHVCAHVPARGIAHITALVAALSCLPALPAHAGLIQMNYTGSVHGYWSLGILADDFPLGTAVSMALTYDDSFLGLPASQFFLGMAPSISGSMNLGGSVYALNTMSLTYFSYGASIDDPSPNYGFHVGGSGPDTDDGEVFSGLNLNFGGSSLGAPSLIGFGDGSWFVANNGYLQISGATTHQQLPNAVPAPGSLALFLAGLGAWGLARPVRKPVELKPAQA